MCPKIGNFSKNGNNGKRVSAGANALFAEFYAYYKGILTIF